MLERLLTDLAALEPVLVGSLPLGLQVVGSPIEIACTCSSLDRFEQMLSASLGALGGRSARFERLALKPEAALATVSAGEQAIEIFCQPLAVHAQARFRCMVIEGQLLVLGGVELRERVLVRKRAGEGTEAAFARILARRGDPQAAVLELAGYSQHRLHGIINAGLHADGPLAIACHEGDRDELLATFRLADDSDRAIAGYLVLGEVLVARDAGAVVGHVQMIADGEPTTWELKSLAVVDSLQGSGLGRRLVEAGIAHARQRGARRVVLSTATADTDLLRFYQRLGFRMTRVERDVFTPAAGYPEALTVDGVRLLDRVWLEVAL